MMLRSRLFACTVTKCPTCQHATKLTNDNGRCCCCALPQAKKFEHSYERNEDCYILQGKAVVTPDGGEPTELVPGDFATFPVGMSASWDVKEPLRKHYRMH
jgi:uncharacterized cupin superfamily protein